MNRSSTFTLASLACAALLVGTANGGSPDTTKKNTKTPNPTKATGKTPSTPQSPSKTTNSTPTPADPTHVSKLTKSIDTNGDGIISVEEWNQLNPQIGNSAENWLKGLTDTNHPSHSAMVRRFDSNKNGTIDSSERELAVREWQNTLVGALVNFDKDRDGKFSTEERNSFVASGKSNANNAKRAANNTDNSKSTQPNNGTRPSPNSRRVNVDGKGE